MWKYRPDKTQYLDIFFVQCRLHNVDPRFIFEDTSPLEKIKNTIVDTHH